VDKKLIRLFRPSRTIYYVLMVCFAIGSMMVGQYLLGTAELIATGAAFFVHLSHQQASNRRIRQYLQRATDTLESTGQGASPFPAVLVQLGDESVVWCNGKFTELTGVTVTSVNHQLQDVLPGVSVDWLAAGKTECPQELTLNGRRYRLFGTAVKEKNGPALVGVIYLNDLTELYQVRDEYIRSRPVVSIIMVDNYEELTKNLTESAISTLNAKLNDSITLWTEPYQGLLRKLERNRFLFVFEKRDLEDAVNHKFSLLENIHSITSPSGLAASVSIGLGVDGSCFEEAYNFAALGIEMALSRGGDQAVIKDRMNFTFFGGRSVEAEYSSKVRSRVTAGSLMELIGQSSQVFVMGHSNADLDSLGAAMGICCLCRKKGKPANIVIDLEHNSTSKLISQVLKVPEYEGVFISGQEAMVACDKGSVLVVVDTNRPDQVEFKPLLEAINKVCVVDHHRRAADYISPVVLDLHETYASSASELVTELLIYGVDSSDVLPIEAKALLAGICMDTKFFNVRTGERTFEAAAALRRMGADTTEVKLLMQNDFQGTVAKYQIVRSARLYRGELAIAALNYETNRILAAQAADDMLNISGITASFVLFPDNGQTIISARSIGKVNVQVILEELGGGGNAMVAGAQMKDTPVDQALDRLVEAIDKFYEG
jgi:c-di-AMP phosphodiesterase-like protein